MGSHNLNLYFVSLLLLVVVSSVLYVYSSQVAMSLEGPKTISKYGGLYFFNVVTAFCSALIGGTGLILLRKEALNIEVKKEYE